jgi:mannose-1-phosphate guanylyltransferase/mannose-6-phosphate isomerase
LAEWFESVDPDNAIEDYASLPDISLDYGIAEKIGRQAVVKAPFNWDDLGNWEAIYRLSDKDGEGNATSGDVLQKGCSGSMLFSRGGMLAAVGVENLIVVQTRDATLVCSMDQVQRVREVVDELKARGSQLVEAHVTVHRPWGSYTVLEEHPGYKVKRLTVLPGARLSEQMHHHRSEHWVVIRGTAKAEVDGVEHLLVENQSIDIPKGGRHRLSNPGKMEVEIIEVQSGPYLEEDDIVRFDDIYGRTGKDEGEGGA